MECFYVDVVYHILFWKELLKIIKKYWQKLKNCINIYDFGWYINRILPIIQKFIDAKEGNIDVDFFKNKVQENTITEAMYGSSGIYRGSIQVPGIKGWILKFFAYYNSGERMEGRFDGEEIKIKDFKDLANQMLIVTFTIVDINEKEYLMKYSVDSLGVIKMKKMKFFQFLDG